MLAAAVATLGAVFSVAYSLRFIFHVFFGPVRDDYPHKPHDPPFGMWAAPALLVVLVMVIGLYPAIVEPLVRVAGAAVIGWLAVLVLPALRRIRPAFDSRAVSFISSFT